MSLYAAKKPPRMGADVHSTFRACKLWNSFKSKSAPYADFTDTHKQGLASIHFVIEESSRAGSGGGATGLPVLIEGAIQKAAVDRCGFVVSDNRKCFHVDVALLEDGWPTS